MNIVKINVVVYCLKFTWDDSKNYRYRIYINDDLLTERTWSWDTNTKINENIIVDLPRNSDNTIKIEAITTSLESSFHNPTKFILSNLQIDDQVIDSIHSIQGETTEIPFKIYKYTIPRKKDYETFRIHQRRF
jgi:hypothetical protein